MSLLFILKCLYRNHGSKFKYCLNIRVITNYFQFITWFNILNNNFVNNSRFILFRLYIENIFMTNFQNKHTYRYSQSPKILCIFVN